MKLWKYLWPWLLLGLSLLAWYLAPMHPEWVEALYSRRLFAWLVWPLATLSAWLPLPATELAVLVGLVLLLLAAARAFRRGPWWQALLRISYGLAVTLAVLLSAFVWLWGLNYWRLPLTEQLQLPEKLAEDPKRSARELASAETNRLRQLLSPDEQCLDFDWQPEHWQRLQKEQSQRLAELGWPAPARSVRTAWLSPAMTSLQIAGFYSPWLAQANINGQTAPGLLPQLVAHELAHANGVGPEHEADLLAYMTLWQAEDPWLVYSGWLAFWFRAGDSTELGAAVKADLACIRDHRRQFEPQQQQVRQQAEQVWQVYDSYLQQSGVEQGLASYGQGPEWALAYFWRQRSSLLGF